jgi:hypothetical protein
VDRVARRLRLLRASPWAFDSALAVAVEERLRLARELHDVVAHSMSVIPEEAGKALAAIEATSRAALEELRRLFGVLRQDGEPQDGLAPAPGLAELDSLLAEVAKAGLGGAVAGGGDTVAAARPAPLRSRDAIPLDGIPKSSLVRNDQLWESTPPGVIVSFGGGGLHEDSCCSRGTEAAGVSQEVRCPLGRGRPAGAAVAS